MSTSTKLRDLAGKLRGAANDLDDIAEDMDSDLGQQALAVMERSCQSKRSYDTPEAAGQAAADRGVEGLRVYLCTFCKGYHLTKTKLGDFQQRHDR